MNSVFGLRFYILVFVMVISGVEAAGQNDTKSNKWQEFKSKEGGFSIQFPSNPVAKTTHQSSVIGKVTNHIFTSTLNHEQFSVDYSDLPGFAVAFAGDDRIYRHASGALLKRILGKSLSNEAFKYQGHSGRHLIYDIPPVPEKPTLYGEAYLFLVDKRLYVINAIAPANTSKAKIHHFLNSLRFE